MRILYIGSLDGRSTAIYYYTNLIRHGVCVVPHAPTYLETSGIVERAVLGLHKTPLARRIQMNDQQIINICRQNTFDAVFVMGENFLSADAMQIIRNLRNNAPIFIYHSHDNNFAPGILKPENFFEETLKSYDFVFTTKSQNVSRYQQVQPRSYYIPSAYESSVHQPVHASQSLYANSKFDVTFVGTYDKSREPILDQVGWQRLNVWGSHWKKSVCYQRYPERITPHPIYYFEFADVITSSKLSLGLLRLEAQDLHTQRTFEIPACGGVQLAPRNDEILGFFQEDKEILCYGSLDELKSKVDFYLRSDKERQRIARAAYQRCIKSGYTYFDRVATMLKISGLMKDADAGLYNTNVSVNI